MNTEDRIKGKHPGYYLEEILHARNMLQAELAFILGQQSANGINTIVQGRRGISPEMSKALGEALQLPHDFFANLQNEYDLAHANEPDPTVAIRAAMQKTYPVREMIKRGWIEAASAENLQIQLANFFEVSSVDQIPHINFAAKKSKYVPNDTTPTQLVWLFRVRQIAKSITVPAFSELALKETLGVMSDMLIEPEEARKVPILLANCGVRLVFVDSLPGSKIDGVCFWLDKRSPVIGMSLRYDRIDNFWFVLRHEIEHVLRRDGLFNAVIDDFSDSSVSADGKLPIEEQAANEAAADFCVPKNKMDSFIARKKPFFYEKDVLAFARLHGIHPGIVVGQIQHRINRPDYLRKYQVKIRHCVLPGAIADGWGQTVPL